MSFAQTDLLTQLLHKKYETLLQLRTVGEQQQTLIVAGDIEQLLALLAGKQQLLAALQALERQLDPFRDQAPNTRQWRTDEQRALCARLVSESDTLLAQVLEHERRGEREILAQRDEAARRLQSLTAVSSAHGAYAAATQISSSQLNMLSEV